MDIVSLLRYGVFELLLPLAFTLALVVFLWGSFQYFIAGGHDEEAKEKGKSILFYGLLVFVGVIVAWFVCEFLFSLFT